MNRRQIEIQVRAIVVTYRVERRRRDASTMKQFRERAHSILDAIEEEARAYPDLAASILRAREELDSGRSSPG